MKVWGLGFSSHAVRDYIELNLFFSADHSKTAVIHCKIHIVDDLKANVLIETDILISEKIDILLSQWKAIVESCQNVQLDLNVTTLLNQTNWLLLLNNQTMIPVYDSIIVQIKSLQGLLTDCNLLFESECKLADIYTSIIDYTVISIEVQNASDKDMIISHHTPLGWIVKYKADSCFLVSSDLLPHTRLFKSISWVKTTFQTLLVTTAVYHTVSSISVELEQQLLNSITVYEQITAAVTALNKVVNHYLSLWKDNGNMTDISESEWIEILLLNNW